MNGRRYEPVSTVEGAMDHELDDISDALMKEVQSGQSMPKPPKSSLKPIDKFLIFLTVSIGMLSVVINGLFASFSSQSSKPDLSKLEHISSYIGLSSLPSSPSFNATHEASLQISNYPHLLTQISSSNPSKVYPANPADHLNPSFGSVSPDAGRFLLDASEGVRTIGQWRIADFGMERCQIELDLSGVRMRHEDWAWPTPVITIYRMSSPSGEERRFLDTKRLSWSNRPTRKEKVAEWKLESETVAGTDREGVYKSGVFECKWDERPIFEYECLSTGCLIDFWNWPGEKPNLKIIQRSSLI